MEYLIDYVLFIFNKVVEILDMIKLPGTSSLLMYLLGAIIIGFVLKLVKGGTSEFGHSTDFMTPRIISNGISKYGIDNEERKIQLIESNSKLSDREQARKELFDTKIRLNDFQANTYFDGRNVVTLREYEERFK